MTTTQMQRSNAAYRTRNPWYIQNLQNAQALCGRYPTQAAATAAAEREYGEVVAVQGFAVLVSRMPCL